MHKKILIVGGSSGLGLELAEAYASLGHEVFITGRKDPVKQNIKFFNFSIEADSKKLIQDIDDLVNNVPKINTLIYAAGFYQSGRIDTLADDEILQMINVGLTAPTILVNRFKKHSETPLKFIAITSSSQFTPREVEPIYTATKAGLGMLSNSLALDPEIGKVVVYAPSGMQTKFWENDAGKDTSGYLDPKWVTQQILETSGGKFKYRLVKIVRDPARVEIVETRE